MTVEFVIATSKRTGKAQRLTADQASRLKSSQYADLFRYQDIATPPELDPGKEKPEPSTDKKGNRKNRK